MVCGMQDEDVRSEELDLHGQQNGRQSDEHGFGETQPDRGSVSVSVEVGADGSVVEKSGNWRLCERVNRRRHPQTARKPTESRLDSCCTNLHSFW